MNDREPIELDVTSTAGDSAPAPAHRDELARGDAIGRYIVVRKIGEGGMGVVYAAYDSDLDRKVALKLLRNADGAANRAARERLLREARAMARLNHPNVITVYEVGTVGQRDFVAMEFIDGGDLEQWAKEHRPSVSDAVPRRAHREFHRAVLDIFFQAGRGLAAAHHARLIHRDFKPSNVLVGKDGRVRVTDFGIARILDDGSSIDGGDVATGHEAVGNLATLPVKLSRTGAIVGTPAYMAPEQYGGESVDERTDQFSFCASLYEALYGERPFAGDTFEALSEAVGKGHVRPEPDGTAVPSGLRTVLLRGLSPQRDARYPSMDALLGALRRDTRSATGRYAVVGVAVLATAGALLGARTGLDAADPCQGSGRAMSEAWNDARREQVRLAFSLTGVSYADTAYSNFVRVVDDYTDSWVAMHEQACRAAYAGDLAQSDLVLRNNCLEDRRRDLMARVDVYSRADERSVGLAVEAIAGLDSVAGCADLDSLRKGIKPPNAVAMRASVDEVETDLQQVAALAEADRDTEAERLAEASLEKSQELGYRPLMAQAAFRLGKVLGEVGKTTRAREMLHEAIVLAEESGYEEIRARAMLAMTLQYAERSSDYGAARRWARRARAAIDRYDPSDRLLNAALDGAEAYVLTKEMKTEEALQKLEGARRSLEAADDAELELARVLLRIGLVHISRGQNQAAVEPIRRVVELRERKLGERHPKVAEAWNVYAAALRGVWAWDKARAAEQRATDFWRSGYGKEVLLAERADDKQQPRRTVKGRVVDALGAPVSGAEVGAARVLRGDGKYGITSGSVEYEHRAGFVRTVTDADGRFVLEGLHADAPVAVVADHVAVGRASPAFLPEGAAGGEDVVELALEPVGRLAGSLAELPPSVGAMAVVAIPKLADAPPLDPEIPAPPYGLAVDVSEDGRFEFERLTAGDYELLFAAVNPSGGQDMITREVTVTAGGAATLDTAFSPGQVTLAIQLSGRDGYVVRSAQVVVLPGKLDPVWSARALNEMVASDEFDGRLRARWANGAGTYSFGGLEPGDYSICVAPVDGDFADPEFITEMASSLNRLALFCEVVEIRATEGVVEVAVESPAMRILDE